MFILQALEDKKELVFPNQKKERKHFSSISDYYTEMGVNRNGC